MKKKELKGFRIQKFDADETGVLIPEGSIFMGIVTSKVFLSGNSYSFRSTYWAVPLQAYDIIKKIKQKNKEKSTEIIFKLKPIL